MSSPRLRVAGLAALLMVAATAIAGTAGAASDDGAERIEFAPGTDNATVTGTFADGFPDEYVLRAGAGQTMTISGHGSVRVSVLDPNGTRLPGGPADPISFALTVTGDYTISVAPGMGEVESYTINVRIPAPPAATAPPGDATRIEFAPGTDYGSVSGTVAAGEVDSYVLRAAAGQTMIVVAASVEQNAVVTVLAPNGTVIGAANVSVFAGTLTATGDYRIEVKGGVNTAASTYGLGVHVPGPVPAEPTVPPTPSGIVERLQFAPGTDNASVSGAIVLGTTDRYLLRAAAGQTMVIHVDSDEDNAVFHVFAPDATPLVTEQQQATFVLPADGDYVVEVGATRGNATYQLSVWIE